MESVSLVNRLWNQITTKNIRNLPKKKIIDEAHIEIDGRIRIGKAPDTAIFLHIETDPTIFSSNQATKLEITLEEGWSDDLDPYYMDDYVFAGFIYAPINKNRYWFFATLQHVYLYIDALITKVNEIFQSTPNPKLLFKRVELWDCHEHFGGIHEFIEVTKSLKGYMEVEKEIYPKFLEEMHKCNSDTSICHIFLTERMDGWKMYYVIGKITASDENEHFDIFQFYLISPKENYDKYFV
uniref:Uncharacterized protein n=1 Tax=Acrobeloides nanus TaxID=290746 RepID=A0A914C4M1_9BILA